MLSFLTVALVAVLVLPTYGKWNVTRQTPNATALVTTRQFTIEIDSAVNRPTFRSLIRFLNGKSNASIEQIDVSNTSSSANYSNNTLSFALQNPARWNFNDEFYILFDDGVLFSGNATNSSAQTSMQFWYLKIIDTSATMMPSDTSARAMTTMPYTSGAADTTGQNSNTSTVSFIAGEPSPTRSAQVGMALGIIFISIIVVGEVLYFKFCYDGQGRSDNYYP